MSVAGQAQEVLERLVGPGAVFRPGQLDAIAALVEERRRVLVVQRTGWGKSAVYFVATRLLRDAGAGPTLLVSPLLSLMRNQIDAAERAGIRAVRITSDNRDEWNLVEEQVRDGEIDLLLVAPERFANARFRSEVLVHISQHVGLFVIDEAHCISDRGHDFRPDYRRLARTLDLLPTGVPVLCTTATANDRVVDDIVDQLGAELLVLRGALDRESLALDVIHLPTQPQRLAWLARTIPQLPGTGIVYTLTVHDACRPAAWLRKCGIVARSYTGEEPTEDRLEVETMLLANEIKCVVATSALGMGYDKPDLAFVIHYQVPGSAVAYYQQVGRAGRALDHAYAIALVGSESTQIQDFFITIAFPPPPQAEAVVAHLEQSAEWTRVTDVEALVNLRRSRMTNMLKILEVEGVVEREGSKYRRTLAPWTYPVERVGAITRQRRVEQQRMLDYLVSPTCLLEFLRRELDDPNAEPCGRCSRCLGAPLVNTEIDTELAREAVAFLRTQDLDIEPRKRWANGTAIPKDLCAETGRVLAMYGDGGWGTLVREQKLAGVYDKALADALVALLRKRPFEVSPAWVTCVPSQRHPTLVPALAAEVAQGLGLPFHTVIAKAKDTAPQKEMDNSAQQYANVVDAFSIAGPVPAGPVLLIDDIVDSRWTLTVIAAQLRQNGSGPVFPVVLARALSD
jgi:ATP-dependent DNA helicase RecQ